MNISKMREYAFMLLYELEIQKDYSEENIELFLENNNIEDKNAYQGNVEGEIEYSTVKFTFNDFNISKNIELPY